MDSNTATTAQDAALQIKALADRIRPALASVILGQEDVLELMLVGLIAQGHLLLEGLPGTAKTTLAKTLARLLQVDFNRIQLTPDMLPAEITGNSIYDLNTRTFSFRRGPIFTDVLLADEINRTPPKTQSALLEAMEERQVTSDGGQHPLNSLFTVIATLNPIEMQGTYPLPEAQLDRFMMKIIIGYPGLAAEKEMLRGQAQGFATPHGAEALVHLSPVAGREELLAARQMLNAITVEEPLLDYLLAIVEDTRQNPNTELGCSPRGALAFLAASRAHAALQGRAFVNPDDIKTVAPAVLRHRLLLTAEAELDELTPEQVIQLTLNRLPIPR